MYRSGNGQGKILQGQENEGKLFFLEEKSGKNEVIQHG